MLELILNTIQKEYSLTREILTGKQFIQKHAWPRQVAYYLLRNRTAMTLKEIGALFSRDHSTILHGCQTVQDLANIYPKYASQLRKVESAIDMALEPEPLKPGDEPGQGDEYEEDDDEYYDDDDIDEDDFADCGKLADGTCMLAGTEFCDWDCPYSREEEE